MITIDETQELLNSIAESLPQDFYNELNGGILLLPEAKLSPNAVNNDLWILGEYNRSSSMGRYISIYYGSFMKVYGNLNVEEFTNQLENTLVHEFTHHLESLAGEYGLEKWDDEQLRKYLNHSKQKEQK